MGSSAGPLIGPRRSDAGAGGELVYALGDVHGRNDLLSELLALIERDASARARGRRPMVVFLGDYIDRGPGSPEVLESLIALRGRHDLAVRVLKGNHEQAMLDFLEAPSRGLQWFAFGGLETLLAYGVWPPAPAEGSRGLVRVRDDLQERLPPAHLRLLASLELMVTVGDYAFVHAGVRPGRSLQAQDETDLIWIREPFLGHREPFGKIIVHGHTWTGPEPQLMANRIGLDTGAFATGVLTAARIEDGEFEILQVRGKGGSG